MRVGYVIEALSNLHPDEDVAISWWDRETVEASLGAITDDAWGWLCDRWETGSDDIRLSLDEYFFRTGEEWKVGK
jgi:hypothetical protein